MGYLDASSTLSKRRDDDLNEEMMNMESFGQ